MNKKILIVLGSVWSLSGFSQTNTPLSDSYQPPQTVINQTVQMLPGFHADSKNVIYNNGGQFIARSDNNVIGGPVITPSPAVYNPSGGENYIYKRTYLAPVTTSNNYAPQVQDITYFDGLGRPKQNIAIKSAPNGDDLVTTIPYDPFGRQVDSWLPVPMATKNGNIQTNVVGATNSFYSDPQNGFDDTYPFRHLKLENSPIDRIEERTNPGGDWQTKPVKYTYDTNIDNEVKKFITTTGWDEGATSSILKLSSDSNQFVSNGHYKKGTLYKSVISDEDNNIEIVFKNGSGQVVLIRKVNGNESIDTYYVYNEYNQLAFIVPPLAAANINFPSGDLNEQSSIIKDLCYVYKYDQKNRLVEKKLPGKSSDYMVYDLQDRMVMSQDAKMRESDLWLFTKFDQFGRIAYSGISNGGDRVGEQTAVDAKGLNNVSRTDSFIKYNGLNLYYTHIGTYPESASITELYSVNYYDTYPKSTDSDGTTTEFPSRPNDIDGVQTLGDNFENNSISTKGLPTANYLRNVEDNRWAKIFVWYDYNARTIGNYSVNHLGGHTETKALLDFTGIPLNATKFHKRTSIGELVTIKEEFKYDHQNRLLKHYHEVVGKSQKELLSENTYDRIGKLKTKKVGGIDNSPIQTVNYTYNIRGWLTGINKNDLDDLGDKLFAYEIKYQNPSNPSVAPEKFNGNIAEVDWRMHGGTGKRRYGYRYDNLDRLSKATYQDPNEVIPETNIYNESATYDVNGNIRTLQRFAKHPKLYTPVIIDNLDYQYEGNNKSNRLSRINDISQNPTGYEGGNNIISYDDVNGNMIVMPDKGITNISYNFLDLPTRIDKGNSTDYYYRADGVKIKKKFTLTNSVGISIINTEYIDGFQYSTPNTEPLRRAIEEQDPVTLQATTAGEMESFQLEERIAPIDQGPIGPVGINLILSFFPTSEGFYDYENFRYIYQYKDQVGNVRISYTKKSNGEIDIRDRNDYYPFGMNFPKNSARAIYDPMAIPYNYKFQEQELQETGFYGFKWRNYMPDVGRFFNVDPLSEKYEYQSHYNFSENWLTNARELEGLEAVELQNGDMMINGLSLFASEFTKESDGTVAIQGVTVTGKKSSSFNPSSFNMLSGGSSTGFTIPMQQLPDASKLSSYCWHCNDKGGLVMMDSIWDVLGIALANTKPENRYAAYALGALAIGVSRGRATDDVLKGESKIIGLGIDVDLAAHRGTGAIIYENGAWQKAGLTTVDWGKASIDKFHFRSSFREAAENAVGIKFDVSNFNPFYHKPGVTNFEFNHILSNPNLLQKTTFIQNGSEVLWNGTAFIK